MDYITVNLKNYGVYYDITNIYEFCTIYERIAGQFDVLEELKNFTHHGTDEQHTEFLLILHDMFKHLAYIDVEILMAEYTLKHNEIMQRVKGV